MTSPASAAREAQAGEADVDQMPSFGPCARLALSLWPSMDAAHTLTGVLLRRTLDHSRDGDTSTLHARAASPSGQRTVSPPAC